MFARTLSLLAGLALSLAPRLAEADDGVRIGVLADLGVPDGLTAAVAVRPTRWLVAHAGAAHNSAALGGRLGTRLQVGRAAMAPFFALEVGAFAEGDVTAWAKDAAVSAGLDDAEIDRFGYRFGNAHLGLRFGSPTAALYLQAGWSLVSGTFHAVERRDGATMEPSVDLHTATPFRVSTPSGRIGMIGYF